MELISNLLWRLRVIIFYLVITIEVIFFFVVFYLPICVFGMRYENKYKLAVAFSRIFIAAAELICGIKYQIKGEEKLPKGRAYIACPNHQSFWENVFMQLLVPIHSWIIKKELYNIFLFGNLLKAMELIAVDRGFKLSIMQILKQGKKKLDSGLSLVIFPEGTRVLPGVDVNFKPSAAKLAINSQVAIALIVHNAGLYWPKGFWLKEPGLITVKVIEVIEPERFKDFEGARELSNYIQKQINKEKNLLLEQ